MNKKKDTEKINKFKGKKENEWKKEKIKKSRRKKINE